MDEVVSRYTLALDELNVLTSTSYYNAVSEDTTAMTNQIADDFLSFLINAYTMGIESASIMLDHEMTVDVDDMREAIFLVIDGKTFEDRVADHVMNNDLGGLKTLAESEFHRVYNAAVYDGGEDYVESGSFGVNKDWITVRDDAVRETHSYLEGVSVPLEEEFFTFDGDHAPYPGKFTKAENNVNCRCIVKLTLDV